MDVQNILYLSLLQLAFLLAVARLMGEVAKRLGQPAVLGELIAGILLGPSVFGHFYPDIYQKLFPKMGTSPSFLDFTSFLGMTLLLFVTGLETDLKLLRKVSKAAAMVNLGGIVVNLSFGVFLGLFLPEYLLGKEVVQGHFALFLGIAFGLNAIAVLVRILRDLELIQRSIGLTMLGASILDELIGWTLLSILLAFHAGHFQWQGIFAILLKFILFFGCSFIFGRILLRKISIWIDDTALSEGAHTTFIFVTILVFTLLAKLMGFHGILGALLAGILIMLTSRIRAQALHNVESLTHAIFAPIFIAQVGLRVNVWELHSLKILFVIFFVGAVGTTLGCGLGAKLSGFKWIESLSISIGMLVRGAVGLMVATIGLQSGIISNEMYSILILNALLTTLLAPPLLKYLLRYVRVSGEEKNRITEQQELSKSIIKTEQLKMLIPTSGGPNAMKAIDIGMVFGQNPDSSLTLLSVQNPQKKNLTNQEQVKEQFAYAKQAAEKYRIRLHQKQLNSKEPYVQTLLKEMKRDYDLLFLGAAGFRHAISDKNSEMIINQSPCHIAIIKARDDKKIYQNILVPTNGDYYSRLATQFAIIYAKAVGAHITLFHVILPDPGSKEKKQLDPDLKRSIENTLYQESMPKGKKLNIAMQSKVVQRSKPMDAILEEVNHGGYDLVILGSENRTTNPEFYFGVGTEYLIEHLLTSVITVIPKAG